MTFRSARASNPNSRLLTGLLGASVLYDWCGFLVLWFMPQWLFDVFAHPFPTNPFLFRLAALPLLLLPLVYLSAARARGAYPILIRLSIALRVVGAIAIAILVLWHAPPGQGAYWCFAGGDLLWAASYAWAASRQGWI